MVLAPEGSEFFLRFIGSEEVSLSSEGVESTRTITPKILDEKDTDREFSFKLDEDQVIRLSGAQETLGEWGISLTPDQQPKISFFEHPSAALSGSLQLSYSVLDDYGVVGARAVITPLESPDENARP